jgi:transposase InsO family protein
MASGWCPPSHTWNTFLKNHAAGIAAMDLFVVPTIGFRMLYALIVIGHDRRRLLSFGITAQPAAEWVAGQITEAFPWNRAPHTLIRDRDAVYGASVMRRLRAMGIRDHPTAPRSPWQNAYAERLNGSIRQECPDHVIVLGEPRPILKFTQSTITSSDTFIVGQGCARRPLIEPTGKITALPIRMGCTIGTVESSFR